MTDILILCMPLHYSYTQRACTHTHTHTHTLSLCISLSIISHSLLLLCDLTFSLSPSLVTSPPPPPPPPPMCICRQVLYLKVKLMSCKTALEVLWKRKGMHIVTDSLWQNGEWGIPFHILKHSQDGEGSISLPGRVTGESGVSSVLQSQHFHMLATTCFTSVQYVILLTNANCMSKFNKTRPNSQWCWKHINAIYLYFNSRIIRFHELNILFQRWINLGFDQNKQTKGLGVICYHDGQKEFVDKNNK